MQKKIVCTLLLMGVLAGGPATALAGVGAEIGASFPVVGMRTSTTGSSENYAIFHAEPLTIEAEAKEEKEGLSMAMKVTNPTDQPFTIAHRDGQSYDFIITDAGGKVLYCWSAKMAFTQALTSSSIPAKGSVTYTASIERNEYKKIKDKAELIRMILLDSDYWVGLRVPKRHTDKSNPSPVTMHGSIEIGNGHSW